MKTTINNTDFTIEEWERDAWYWRTDKDESEECHDSACAAMQNAIDYVQLRIEEKTMQPDNYQNEVFQSFNKRDYV